MRRTIANRPERARADVPIHLGWQRLRAALRGAGLLPGLVQSNLRSQLGPASRQRPTDETVFGLVQRHLAEHDSVAEGRFLLHRAGEGDTARGIVAQLARILPELPNLILAEETHASSEPGRGYVLRTQKAFARVPEEDIELERLDSAGDTFVRRTVSVDALVESANCLLHVFGIQTRLFPMRTPEGVLAYLGADMHAAALLETVGFWDGNREEIMDFTYLASWPASPQRHTRRVA